MSANPSALVVCCMDANGIVGQVPVAGIGKCQADSESEAELYTAEAVQHSPPDCKECLGSTRPPDPACERCQQICHKESIRMCGECHLGFCSECLREHECEPAETNGQKQVIRLDADDDSDERRAPSTVCWRGGWRGQRRGGRLRLRVRF